MELSVNVATGIKISPFELFDQEVDEVILFINYFIEKGLDTPNTDSNKNSGVKRVKQDDGFWSF